MSWNICAQRHIAVEHGLVGATAGQVAPLERGRLARHSRLDADERHVQHLLAVLGEHDARHTNGADFFHTVHPANFV
ncbi:MAG: hypothetical protein MUC34_15065 [Anaerolineae bacterium]|nr:hypothetical protein [Anaerolineae bacterium]